MSQLPQHSASKREKVRGNNKLKNFGDYLAGKYKGSGQLSHEPVHRVVAGRFALRRYGRCWPLPNFSESRFMWASLSRRILSSLHRGPERRKRNAHCTAFRQSLHCLIAERCSRMHLKFLSGAISAGWQVAEIKEVGERQDLREKISPLPLGNFTLARVFSRRVKRGLRGSSEWVTLLPRNGSGRTSSFCTVERRG